MSRTGFQSDSDQTDANFTPKLTPRRFQVHKHPSNSAEPEAYHNRPFETMKLKLKSLSASLPKSVFWQSLCLPFFASSIVRRTFVLRLIDQKRSYLIRRIAGVLAERSVPNELSELSKPNSAQRAVRWTRRVWQLWSAHQCAVYECERNGDSWVCEMHHKIKIRD